MEQLQQALQEIFQKEPVWLVISNRRQAGLAPGEERLWTRANVRPVTVAHRPLYQFELLTKTQAFHENLTAQQAAERARQLLSQSFCQLDGQLREAAVSLKISKKGKLLFRLGGPAAAAAPAGGHNRQKQYLLPEGEAVPALVDLGVLTADGQVIRAKYDKYRQINRFVEMVSDLLPPQPPQPLKVLDFGCGKSYLTFVLYHYLTRVRQLPARIVGLDLKEEVVAHCNRVAQKYGYDQLSFQCGDIAGFDSGFHPDLVVTLHACDTATDLALYHAICRQVPMILSVPCCQHEFNHTLQAPALSLLTDYGILKERFAALATDAMRAKLLEACGYQVQVLEFIDLEHSPKNLLIRARKLPSPSAGKMARARMQVEQFLAQCPGENTLYRLLQQDGRLPRPQENYNEEIL